MKKKPTGQVLIHITSTYSTKNQLQKITLENVKKLDNTIHGSLDIAKEAINDALKQSENQCKTRCRRLDAQYWQGMEKDVLCMNIADVIRLEFLTVYTIN